MLNRNYCSIWGDEADHLQGRRAQYDGFEFNLAYCPGTGVLATGIRFTED
ncbi:MAG: hypothetical protein U0176_03200 [Bacteroidia bacterium]